MPEYVEREALAEFLKGEIQQCEAELVESNGEDDRYEQSVESRMIGLVDAWRKVTNTPAADVVKVRHGRWEWYVEPRYDLYSCDENFGYRCSECHSWAGEYGVDDDIYEEPPTHILHYCPNCGADMRGENNGKK